jgi:phospholipid/cholesterol/gamma-HCH transport system permease protein
MTDDPGRAADEWAAALHVHPFDEGLVASPTGDWTAVSGRRMASEIDALDLSAARGGRFAIMMADVDRLDTVGVILLGRLQRAATAAGATPELHDARPEHATLLSALEGRPEAPHRRPGDPAWIVAVAALGAAAIEIGQDLKRGVAFFGAVMVSFGRIAVSPRRFRFTATVNHVHRVCLNAVPIIALISFLVGAILAQQSIFQLKNFGATLFVVDLLGILVLRELGVLLTAIMVAGRSGSAFTAEIGSMKMREEIDALKTMGLDAIEILAMPRLAALAIALPLLSFIASMAALLGGGLVAWTYGDITPITFLQRLKDALTLQTFMVGLVKAPFMAVVIGLIACTEGMKVEGSAESLGARTTSSVVKSIFVVIVLDGVFAITFAAIGI